jgi:hypothetical protein
VQIEHGAVVRQYLSARRWRIADYKNFSLHSLRSQLMTGRCMRQQLLTLLSMVNRLVLCHEGVGFRSAECWGCGQSRLEVAADARHTNDSQPCCKAFK